MPSSPASRAICSTYASSCFPRSEGLLRSSEGRRQDGRPRRACVGKEPQAGRFEQFSGGRASVEVEGEWLGHNDRVNAGEVCSTETFITRGDAAQSAFMPDHYSSKPLDQSPLLQFLSAYFHGDWRPMSTGDRDAGWRMRSR